jgi:hypothetical protein
MNPNSGWFWVGYAVVWAIVMVGGAWLYRTNRARRAASAKLTADRERAAIESFELTMSTSTGRLTDDLRRWQFGYRVLSSQFAGRPPVAMTELLFTTMLEAGDVRTKGSRAA